MQSELIARVEELLREQLRELGEDVKAIKPHEYAEHMKCRVFSDQSMVYSWKGLDILRVVPDRRADGSLCWRMFTGDLYTDTVQ